jgi:hypothetical protein
LQRCLVASDVLKQILGKRYALSDQDRYKSPLILLGHQILYPDRASTNHPIDRGFSQKAIRPIGGLQIRICSL